VVRNATPIIAFITDNFDQSHGVLNAPIAWAANHVYADNFFILEVGHLWYSTGVGTSGGSLPNFAGHIGGSVGDGLGTWTDGSAVPTVGATHLYAQVATPPI
jgi:hypothetical protein